MREGFYESGDCLFPKDLLPAIEGTAYRIVLDFLFKWLHYGDHDWLY